MRVGHNVDGSGHVVIVLSRDEARRVEKALEVGARLAAALPRSGLLALVDLLDVWRLREAIPVGTPARRGVDADPAGRVHSAPEGR